MFRKACNRRDVLTISGLSLGGLLIGSSLAFSATEAELSGLIKEIIHTHYPEARDHGPMVDQFVRDLLTRKMDCLEPQTFLKQEAGKTDKSALERYVLVQFMTSPGFIALQDK
ncbi:hypothetical protein [Oligoflexus tunisiensis]|uniref:hypothetical protein n=1 Tax=Oligoflexus tunisiensis TaxID=708132 RepID=UPI00114D0F20|nr:hypothetical protein [Oligoflexus tunisiensis]